MARGQWLDIKNGYVQRLVPSKKEDTHSVIEQNVIGMGV
jgi:hypothetical protein